MSHEWQQTQSPKQHQTATQQQDHGGGNGKVGWKYQGWIVHPEFGEHRLPAQFELKKKMGKWRGKWKVLANEQFSDCSWAQKTFHDAIESFEEENDVTWVATGDATAFEDVMFSMIGTPEQIEGGLELLKGHFYVCPKGGTKPPMPVSSWDFTKDCEDHLDSMHVETHGPNGSVRRGDRGLILDDRT